MSTGLTLATKGWVSGSNASLSIATKGWLHFVRGIITPTVSAYRKVLKLSSKVSKELILGSKIWKS